jgi:hypothetical protein
MKLFFCETCGKRVTDSDLQSGAAADKQVKGIYCKECAQGVMTIQFAAITLPSSVPQASAKASPQIPDSKQPVSDRPSSRPSRVVERAKTTNSQTGIYAGIAGLAVIALLAIFLFSNDASKKSKTEPEIAAKNEPVIESRNEPTKPPKEPKPEPKIELIAEQAPAISQSPAAGSVPKNDGQDDEQRARVAFDKLQTALAALDPSNKAEREKLAEAYLKEYGDTIVAARVGAMLSEWRKPLVAPVTPTPTIASHDDVPTTTPPAKAAVEKESGTFLFNGKDLEGWSPDGRMKGHYQISDNMLVVESGTDGIFAHASPGKDYAVEVEFYMEDGQGAYLEILTHAGKVCISRDSAGTRMKILVKVNGANLQSTVIEGKGKPHDVVFQGGDMLGLRTAAGGAKKIHAVRLLSASKP